MKKKLKPKLKNTQNNNKIEHTKKQTLKKTFILYITNIHYT